MIYENLKGEKLPNISKNIYFYRYTDIFEVEKVLKISYSKIAFLQNSITNKWQYYEAITVKKVCFGKLKIKKRKNTLTTFAALWS